MRTLNSFQVILEEFPELVLVGMTSSWRARRKMHVFFVMEKDKFLCYFFSFSPFS